MLRLLLSLLLLLLSPAPGLAQIVPEAEPEPQAEAPADPYGRATPRGAITGLLDALGSENYSRAAAYFELPEMEGSEDAGEPAAGLEDGGEVAASAAAGVARQLQAALDRGGTLQPYGLLSNDPAGNVNDTLPPELEQVGTFGGETPEPILLARGAAEAGGEPVWRISRQTIEQLETLAPLAVESDAERMVLAGAPLADWALLLAIALGSFLLYWLISAGILALMRAVIPDQEKRPLYRLTFAALPPLSLFLAIVSFQFWTLDVEASIVARQTLVRYAGIIAWVALAWFGLRLVDAIAGLVIARMERKERRQAISIVALMRRATKALLLAVAVVAILDTLGFDVTTGIAALGIGGIALALGAQKTVENLVGSVTLIADRPAQIGDFCRVGGLVGTIEDIGMRSTQVRTLERSLVTIPNGDMAAREIENFAMRDRFLFNPVIGVDYGISADKLREGVEIIEQVLVEHERVETEGARARFADFGASSLDIEVFSYITVSDFTESRLIRQELLLAIFSRLEAAGLTIAFPTRTVHLIQENE